MANGGIIGPINEPTKTDLLEAFTSPGTFTSRPTTSTAGVLVIGGGGGGGNSNDNKGGGGGAGGGASPFDDMGANGGSGLVIVRYAV